MKCLAGALFAVFFLILMDLLFRIWLEGRRERMAPRDVPGEALPEELRENALRPLRQLNAYYEKRDPELADGLPVAVRLLIAAVNLMMGKQPSSVCCLRAALFFSNRCANNYFVIN